MDQDLVKIIEDAGFTDKEARVYLGLLELGQGTVYQIAKTTDLKRPIIYVILESLEKRGYASVLPNKKANTYQAADPSAILHRLKIVTKNFSEMLPMLQTLHNRSDIRPKITYIENKEGIWNIYEEMNKIKDSLFITSYFRIEKHFPGAVKKWIDGYKKGIYKVQGHHVIPDNETEIELVKNLSAIDQKVRTLSDLNDTSMDFSIFGKKVSITSLEEKPFMVVMESEELARSMKMVFEVMWRSGKEIK
jgi:sugar-specific transcriptional regulator TrmB